MVSSVVRIAGPYLGRYLAGRAADYLQSRKERLEQAAEEQVDKLPSQQEISSAVAQPVQRISAGSAWLIVAGLVLIGVVIAILTRTFVEPDETR